MTSARAVLVAKQVELSWLTHYPLPNKVIVDRGNQFLAKFREMITNDYCITVKPITSRNPKSNTILESVLHTLSNILRTFKVQSMVLDKENLWDGILASTMFFLRDKVHTTTQYTPDQLIFGRESRINRRHNIDWEIIRKQKKELINKGKGHKNCNRINHAYKQEDKV